MTENTIGLKTIGAAIEKRIAAELETSPHPAFYDVEVLRDLSGKDTGGVRVCQADRLEKASFLSIDIGPGRYFNIHVIPDARYDIPRFLYEGMLMPMGSQVSMDLFPDVDAPMQITHLLQQLGRASEVYDAARNDDQLQFQSSRQLHMRAFSSPLFLCAFGLEGRQLGIVERYAHGYLDAWLELYRAGAELSADQAADREARRRHMARTLIDLDPDRHMVVQVYGEETTQAIERACML